MTRRCHLRRIDMGIEWMRLEALVGKEVAIDYLKRTKGEAQAFLPVTIRSCEGDLILAVNALVDYGDLLDQYLKAHKDELGAFVAAYYAEHGERCRRVAGKLAAALGYDREATLQRCQKLTEKVSQGDDIGEDALVLTAMGRGPRKKED